MDPLLAGPKSKNLGLIIQVGTFAHADNIRTTTTNPDDTAERVKTVAPFADRNGLKLNTEKCGIVGMDPPSSVAGLPVLESVKYFSVYF